MKPKQRVLALILAVPGIAGSIIAIAAFLRQVIRNELPWAVDQSVRDFYLAVGNAYTRGFVAGFFLCFFLMLVAVAVGTWFEHRGALRSGPAEAPNPSRPQS